MLNTKYEEIGGYKNSISNKYQGTRSHNQVCLLLLVTFLLLCNNVFAASQLMVTPTRVVFEEKTRSASVTIINTGDTAGTYRISLERKRMTPDGIFEEVKEARPGELFADKMIRYSPRQVVLEPGKSQVVRLGLRKPSKLEAGEYRTHMLFRAIPVDAGKNIEQELNQSSGLSIKLTPIVGIAIPVIVRHGKTNAEVSLVAATLLPRASDKDKRFLQVKLQRSGNRSVYGNFQVNFIPKKGERKVVSRANGVAVYSPGTERTVWLEIQPPEGLELSSGTLDVVYREPMDKGGKVLSQIQLEVP